MDETLLNQNNSGMATSNPQANINQINNNQVGQPIQNNVNTPNTNPNNEVKPITIPIQIQPQIAPGVQSQTSSNNKPSSNLQTINNVQTPQTYNAPTPQTYQGNTNNSNIVDFNQIYNSYNQMTGNNNNFNSSGIKKTSYNTTIVTPTVSNLNSVEGQYQSAYADTVNGLIEEMLKQMQNGFTYDPTQDASLRLATEYAANSTLQSLAGSGVLNSSATSERVARIVSELIPQYEEKAHDRWIEYLGQLADTAQLVMNYDAQQFEYWKDVKDREFQNKQFEYQKQQDALENAWKRVDELGYVDNEASKVLGVAVGTLSGAAREAKEQREFELQKMREQLEIERANNEALARLKSELDLQSSKQLAAYQSSLNKSEADYNYQLQKKYSSISNSKNNFSTYDAIIQNRYAEYDDMTRQYVVPDEQTYNELYNYLQTLYSNGLITDTELFNLASKYSKYVSPTSNSASAISISSGLNSENIDTWIKALDGNNKALDTLGVTINGSKKSFANNSDIKKAVNNALKQIQEGSYKFRSNQQLMNDLKNGVFGNIGWGL